ncbi:hypothetical protein B5C34_12165 [Pacificimonas flava]|uniref:Uncharacterized protein n=2 Tax=Pacificimonas TaxID=1960290 RepID=A0A219B798_9SPHN|nr:MULTISPECIES: hypothetical protein [Pacificimonas]MBZ6378580.1 hypothetical protein [Pacificimonas aurantium]OWV34141.1 hypothetical protein B5C34_12165 [Pacificimonas flava]
MGLLVLTTLATTSPVAAAQAGGDITNFNVKNCTQQRMFVCSFDKTDSLMKIPYKARGVQPGDKKEFGCASLNKCKVIIGVSKKKSSSTLSSGMQTALSSGAAASATGTGLAVAYAVAPSSSYGFGTLVALGAGSTVGALFAVGVGGAVAGIEISDGWSDGEVCNQVRRAARKAGLKPKFFLKNNKNYQVVERYATDDRGNVLVYADGSAVIAYAAQKAKGSCPRSLDHQLVSD